MNVEVGGDGEALGLKQRFLYIVLLAWLTYRQIVRLNCFGTRGVEAETKEMCD
jgi:hypothetical protein